MRNLGYAIVGLNLHPSDKVYIARELARTLRFEFNLDTTELIKIVEENSDGQRTGHNTVC